MEDSQNDRDLGSTGSRSVKRKSSRSNSIVFKAVPENSRYIDESSEDDSSAEASSLALDGMYEAQAQQTPQTRRASTVAFSNQRQSTAGTQKQGAVISAVKRFVTQMSSLGFHSSSEEPSPTSNMRASSTSAHYFRDRVSSTRTISHRRSSGGGSAPTSASMLSIGEHHSAEKYCLSDRKINALRSVLDHAVWTWTINFFVFVMLFGAPIQDLFLPVSADVTIDVIFTLAFVMLLVDIMLRCIVDKAYFAWNRIGTSLTPQNSCKWFNIHAGSFMFWCDVMGTLTFLYDLSYINRMRAESYVFGLEVRNGLQVGTARYSFSYGSVHYSQNWRALEVIVLIGRTARLARLIRSHILVEGMHFYVTKNAKLKYLSPLFWLRKVASLQNYRRKSNRDEKSLAHASERALVGSIVSTPGNMFSIGDSLRRGSSTRNSMISVTEEQERDVVAEKKKCFCFPFKESYIPQEIKRKRSNEDAALEDVQGSEMRNLQSKERRSHVGATMQQLTGQRVALGVFVGFVMNVLCSWQKIDTTVTVAMAVLHGQTSNTMFAKQAVETARTSVIPNLFNYTRGDNVLLNESLPGDIRPREILCINVFSENSIANTTGCFNLERVYEQYALVEIMTTLFIIMVWLWGIMLFVGPVMILVVEPIERMVRLLGMLMKDPLGYANTVEFRNFIQEEENFAEHSMWGKDVLSGMETKFLMNTLLRIGSLMKVGFGSAGVEIIRNNLERDGRKEVLFLNKQGSTVSCIFLFCDIRQFTDATECLQEEVFVFTNKIAAVVHSICNSYGGTANKNIGDAFLVSWLLDDVDNDDSEEEGEEEDMFAMSTSRVMFSNDSERLRARNNQADRALLAVVKISIALHYDNFFVETMNEEARNRLLTKLSKRKGPIVQMGFGLHAGKAVQGAIGSQRKLDATYISESVERAEFLESSTKTYGVPLLMSETFYNLLDSANKYRCRRLDQLLLMSAENDGITDPREMLDSGEKMNIYTFDMDIDALWKVAPTNDEDANSTTSNSDVETRRSTKKSVKRRSSIRRLNLNSSSAELLGGSNLSKQKSRRFSSATNTMNTPFRDLDNILDDIETPETRKRTLILPTGVTKYSDKSWLEPDIKTIRLDLVSNGVLFPKFDDGLKSYYARDWDHAKQCFQTVLSERDDGPSRYFLKCIEKHGGKPPRDFIGYKVV